MSDGQTQRPMTYDELLATLIEARTAMRAAQAERDKWEATAQRIQRDLDYALAERDKFHRAYTAVNARSTDAVIAQAERDAARQAKDRANQSALDWKAICEQTQDKLTATADALEESRREVAAAAALPPLPEGVVCDDPFKRLWKVNGNSVYVSHEKGLHVEEGWYRPADLILVLRHAQAAQQRLNGGGG